MDIQPDPLSITPFLLKGHKRGGKPVKISVVCFRWMDIQPDPLSITQFALPDHKWGGKPARISVIRTIAWEDPQKQWMEAFQLHCGNEAGMGHQ
ncbi:hypothetical protein AVEN_1225-1, partial [Araneus ventricosus]